MTSRLTRALLRLSLVRGVGPARLRRALTAASAEARDDLDTLATAAGLSPDQRSQLAAADTGDAAALLEDALAAKQISLLSPADDIYPAALRRHPDLAPPLLTVAGPVALLAGSAVGFCGSRAASPRGLEVAADCASQLAAAGLAVVSGAAAGVDTAAHVAALSAGGATILILAEGILRFARRAELAAVWDDARVCVVSEFAPRAAWSAGQAMQRNRTIVGLSLAMILIEAGATGGSIAAGREALRMSVPLFAPEYAGMPATATGNRELLREGGRPLLRSRSTMRANLEPVLAVAHQPASIGASATAAQLALIG